MVLATPSAPSVLSCFYYMGDGLRCGDRCPWPLFFCAHHAVAMQRTAAPELFRRVATAVVASTVFTETGLPRLVCRDFEQWGATRELVDRAVSSWVR